MIIKLDSFSFYDQNTIVQNGAVFENWRTEGGDVAVDGIYARGQRGATGQGGLRLLTGSRQSGGRGNVTAHFADNYDTVTIGAAIKIESDNTVASRSEGHFDFDKAVFSILEGTTAQVSLCVTPSMRLRVRRDVAGIELGRSSYALHEGVYYYLEFKVTISGTIGTFSARVDGISRLSGTGNTQVTPNAMANGFRLGSESALPSTIAGRYIRYSDLYVTAEVVGEDHNGFLGDVAVMGLFPQSDRPSNQWSTSAGTLHYALIDDTTPNATDFVRAGTVGYVDTYVFTGVNIPAGSILAVNPQIYARKTTAGVVRVAPLTNQYGTINVGADNYMTQEYRYHAGPMWDRRPRDDEQWPLAFTDDTYFGIKRSG